MDFDYSPKVLESKEKLEAFMEAHVYPAEREHHDFVMDRPNLWKQPPIVEELKVKAREAGIWNWFLPAEYGEFSPGFTNLEFAPLAEVMGRVPWSFEVFNCSAPDRGNMEVLAKFGSQRTAGPVASPAARRQDPVDLRHDRTTGGVVGRNQHGAHESNATATSTCSTVASGGAATSCTRTTRSWSPWGSPTPTASATRGTRWCSCRRDSPGLEVVRSGRGVRQLPLASRPRRTGVP